eukprot:m51a1_g4913 putative gut cathepsin l-like cysteine protease (797) ;mRNA; f:201363-207328
MAPVANSQTQELHFKAFSGNVAEYARRNAEPEQTAVYGANEFADLTRKEFAALFLIPGAAVLEGAFLKAAGKTVVVSPQNILDCADYGRKGWDGCQGFDTVSAMSQLADMGASGGGVALEREYPYHSRMGHCQKPLDSRGVVVVRDYFTEQFHEREGSTVYSRLMHYGPLGISLNAGYLQGYQGGIVRHGADCRLTEDGQDSADHSVTLVGWGVDKGIKYWLIKNSWGPRWGEPLDFASGNEPEGFFRIVRGVRACHITDDPAVGAIVEGGSAPEPRPGPDVMEQMCSPKSRSQACGRRHCGNVDNGCGAPASCGFCERGEACSADGVCGAVDDVNDWAQVLPAGASGDFEVRRSERGGLSITTTTDDAREKRLEWKTSYQWTSDSWTSFSVDVRAGTVGTVGIGMRMGQKAATDSIAWKLVVGSDTDDAELYLCFFDGTDHCKSIAQIAFVRDQSHNFTVNYGLTEKNGERLITMRPFLDSVNPAGNKYFTTKEEGLPGLGSAFIVASGGSKTFASPRLITRTTVRVAMRSCHSTDDWTYEVVRILRVPRFFVTDVQGQSTSSDCATGLFNSFNVTLLDANMTTGIYSKAVTGVAAFNQLAYSNALASHLISIVSGGGLANMGVVGASASVVLPEVVGTAVAGTIAGAAADGGLTTGAIMDMADYLRAYYHAEVSPFWMLAQHSVAEQHEDVGGALRSRSNAHRRAALALTRTAASPAECQRAIAEHRRALRDLMRAQEILEVAIQIRVQLQWAVDNELLFRQRANRVAKWVRDAAGDVEALGHYPTVRDDALVI